MRRVSFIITATWRETSDSKQRRERPATIMVFLVALFSSFPLSISMCFPAGFETAQALCLPDQAAALLKLRRGFSSVDLGPWKAVTDCCKWEGVTCDPASGMVTELHLVDRNISLSGPIDAYIARLCALRVLSLDGNNLSSIAPDLFGELSSLTELTLRYCDLRGHFPESVFWLPSLKVLDVMANPKLSLTLPKFPEGSALEVLVLSSTNLSSILSESLGNLKSLTRLDLSNCSLFGTIPSSIGNLTQLIYLDLSSNKLQGQIPKSIFEFRGLGVLSLAWNNFNDTVELDFIERLTNLTHLDLSNVSLSVRSDGGADDSVPSFTSMSTLKLVSCNLTKIPSFLRYQTMMAILDLSSNRIDGPIPEWMWSIGGWTLNFLNLSCNLFTHLEGALPHLPQRYIITLDLHSNRLKGHIPIPPQQVVILDYSNNYFSSSIPSNITSYLTFTLFFSLSNNSVSGKIPSSICNARYLEVLDLSYNNLSGLIPPCLLQGGNDLRVLNLRGNRFHGILPHKFSNKCQLHTINLNGNELWGRVPKSLANCGSLQVLDLGKNQICDIFPSWLGNISTLRVLVLRSNRFYGHVNPPESHEAFSMLHFFDISANKFDGPLPSKFFQNLKVMMSNSELPLSIIGFKYLQLTDPSYYEDTISIASKGFEMRLLKIMTILTCIDFSNNAFEGNIPEVIGDLKLLYTLNLSHNALTGGIPPVLGTLSQLESLDLSGNLLSGKIPQELTSLTFLSYLDFSYNHLMGVIPTGNQFSTFPNSSFKGNEGLCGSPLSKKCSSPNTNVELPSLESKNASPKLDRDFIWVCLFGGLGFGIGFAVGFSIPILCTKRRR